MPEVIVPVEIERDKTFRGSDNSRRSSYNSDQNLY